MALQRRAASASAGGAPLLAKRAVGEVAQELEETVPSARRCPGRVRAGVQSERDGGGAVEIGERQVGQTGDDFPGVIELARLAPVHRARAVEKQVDVQVFLLDEQLEHERAPARVGVPVDVPPVVAADERAVLGELHARAPRLAAAFGALTAPGEPARRQRERFEPGEKRGVEEKINVGGGAHAARENQASACQASRR